MDLKPKNEGDVTFGDNSKGQIVGIGTIGNKSSIFIENVLLSMVLNTICLVLVNYVIKVLKLYLNA